MTAEQTFAADANGDGAVNTGDSGRLNAVILEKTTLPGNSANYFLIRL